MQSNEVRSARWFCSFPGDDNHSGMQYVDAPWPITEDHARVYFTRIYRWWTQQAQAQLPAQIPVWPSLAAQEDERDES